MLKKLQKIQDKMGKNKEIEEGNGDIKRKTLTFFFLFFPSLLVAMIPFTINGSIIVAWGIKVSLLLYQLVAIRNFVDTHYD